MTSTFTVIPSQHLNGGRLGMPDQPPDTTQGHRARPSSPVSTLNHLSPSTHYHNGSASPTFQDTNPSTGSTPDSIHYQASDFSNSDVGDDFLGVDFGDSNGGVPSFLGESLHSSFYDFTFEQSLTENTFSPNPPVSSLSSTSQAYPLSPEPSLHTVSPPVQRRPSGDVLPLKSAALMHQSQFTPDASDSIPSSDDGMAPTMSHMSARSPRVTVSMWGRDENADDSNMDAKFMGFVAPLDATSGLGAGELPVAPQYEVPRDFAGRWMPDAATGQGGLDPSNRSAAETASINDLATARDTQDKNSAVDSWLSATAQTSSGSDGEGRPQSLYGVGIPDREIGLGCDTRNATKAGQTYFREDTSGSMTRDDVQILLSNRIWGDSPTILPIAEGVALPTQPKTATEAVAKFEAACRDNDSIVSRAATWGTRRRSLPSIVDMEGIVSGNWVKKLSISHAEPKKPNNFLDELFKAVRRRPSASGLANLKRSFTNQGDDDATSPAIERRESGDRLAPPSRSPSWGKRPVPSINTALVEMGNNFAAIGTTHARSGSISSTTPVASPKSPFGLKVQHTFRRRAKSDLPARPKGNSSVSNIAGMWMKAGGPPVANLANTVSVADQEDDDEEEEDQDDSDMSSDATKLIDDVLPNLSGFSEHILKLNPMLAEKNNYLVERIAYQQIARYKSLLTHKVKHMGNVQDGNCQCGKLCIALGGSAVALEHKGTQDAWSARIHGSDEDLSTPLEGAIGQDSFPRDIPMPPTQTLPAEFECQLCFQAKKFQKPSDWTKHVHEDVQPFTCTWDRCREPKIFKRKADWVRHENEGHRHLEWWTCDVADCRHTCYRRDNFLQHLVREHKFQEPKVKTKAAIKRVGGLDRTWQKVESCHAETRARPQDEPCRFCGKTFPTWKKLTVHLAKHMEQISLPILRLVARKHLDADTIVSPVQEPPQRPFSAIPPVQDPAQTHLQAQGGFRPQPPHLQMPGHQRHSPITYAVQQPQFPYGVTSPDSGGPFVSPQFHHSPTPGFDHGLSSLHPLDTTAVLGMSNVSPNTAYQAPHQAAFLDLPISANSYGGLTTPQRHSFSLPVAANGLEPFPQMPISSGSLHDSGAALSFDCGMINTGAGMGAQFQRRTSLYPQTADHQQAGGGRFYQ